MVIPDIVSIFALLFCYHHHHHYLEISFFQDKTFPLHSHLCMGMIACLFLSHFSSWSPRPFLSMIYKNQTFPILKAFSFGQEITYFINYHSNPCHVSFSVGEILLLVPFKLFLAICLWLMKCKQKLYSSKSKDLNSHQMVYSDSGSSDFNMRILCPRIRLSLIFDPMKNIMNSRMTSISQFWLQSNMKYSDFQRTGCLSRISSFKKISCFSHKVKTFIRRSIWSFCFLC